jgi:hypothetical protein
LANGDAASTVVARSWRCSQPKCVGSVRMDQPPDRCQVGADVALQDGLVVGDAVAQVADAPNVCVDGFPDTLG